MERKIIYHEDSEEYKAIKLLEQKTKNYSLDGNDLHYALILYNLIVNLSIENQQLKEKLKDTNESLKNVQQRNREYRNNCFELNKNQKDNWNYIKKMLKEARQEKYISGYCGTCTDVDIDFLLGKMQELQGSNSNE